MDKIVIEQSDRLRALKFYGFSSDDDLQYWGKGEHHQKVDDLTHVLARHRLAERARAAKVADAYAYEREGSWKGEAAEEIAAAIRAGDEK